MPVITPKFPTIWNSLKLDGFFGSDRRRNPVTIAFADSIDKEPL